MPICCFRNTNTLFCINEQIYCYLHIPYVFVKIQNNVILNNNIELIVALYIGSSRDY